MKKVLLVLILILFLAFPLYSGVVNFSGSTSLYTEYYNTQGAEDEDKWTTRLDLRPTLTIYKIPLSLNLYISTEETNLRQALNKFKLLLKPKELAGELANYPGFVFSISGIQAGHCYSDYSQYTLSGIPVTGGAIEFNPGLFYIATTIGRSQRAVEASDSTDAAYKRMLYSGKIGIGKKAGSEGVFLTFLYSKDDPGSIEPYYEPVYSDTDSAVIDTYQVITPQENFVVGLNMKFSAFDTHFTLEGEVTGSEHTRDVTMPEMNAIDAPDWVADFLNMRMCSSFDYAYRIKPAINIAGTEVYGSLSMIGPGFYSFGSPNLRNDALTYETGLSGNYFNNTLYFSGRYSHETDNLLNLKGSTTLFQSYIFNLGIYPRKFPYINLNYSPYFQKNDDDTINTINTRTHVASFSGGHNFKIGELDNSLNIYSSYLQARGTTDVDDYNSLNLSLYDGLSFKAPLYLTGSVGWTQTTYTGETNDLVYFDLSGSYKFFKKWSNTLGINNTWEHGRESKIRIYARSSFPVWKLFDTRFEGDWSDYRRDENPDNYDEFRLRLTLSRSW